MSSTQLPLIISGAGCAGLSLATRLVESGKFADRKLIIVDRSLDVRNDRTWCFWEQRPGYFDDIVYRKWSELYFHGADFSKLLDISPYQYKMIRGIDFYQRCLKALRQAPNVELMTGKVNTVGTGEIAAWVEIDGKRLEGEYVFNSILFEQPKQARNWYFLKQHFKGWIIQTDRPVFQPEKATLMDFRPSQAHGTTFVYVLPFSDTRALVEYTLFTRDLLKPEEYDKALKEYIAQHVYSGSYKIEEEEFGVIPMTNYPFSPANGRVVNIGTAGGQTKPSSGYTFQFIQKYTTAVADSLAEGTLRLPPPSTRFSFYDSTLLQVLDRKKIEGREVFADLFRQGDVQTVLKFLDNETSFREDLSIMRRLPKGRFAMAALREIFR